MEADVYYTKQSYYYNKQTTAGIITVSEQETISPVEENLAKLTYTSVGGGVGNNFHTYEWNRIQSIEDFLETENREIIYNEGIVNIKDETKMTSEGLADLEGMEWVLRFVETDYENRTRSLNASGPTINQETIKRWTHIGDVSILRLAFETNGKYYNLGVIDNKQTGDGVPDNYNKRTVFLSDTGKLLLALIMLLILIVILLPILPFIISVFVSVVSVIVKILVNILLIPLKILGLLFKRK